MQGPPERTSSSHRKPKPPRRWIGWTAVVVAHGGWWLSLDLARLGLGKAASNPWLQAECTAAAEPDAPFDCQAVLHSRWSSIPLSDRPGAPRIPVAVLGMGYFAFAGLWHGFVGSPTRRQWGWHLPIVVVVGLGALTSVWMVWVMGAALDKWCRGCLAVHAVNSLLILLTLGAFPWVRDRSETRPHPRARLALATLTAGGFLFLLHPVYMLAVLATNSANRMYEKHLRIVTEPEFVRWHYDRQPEEPLLAAEQPFHEGDPNAPNTVVVFVDYQCPACKTGCDVLETVMRRHPGALRVNYRHFPLDRSCNDAIPMTTHPGACEASRAAEAARLVGGVESFRAMRDRFYEQLDDPRPPAYASWAGALGMDPGEFAETVQSDEVTRRIREDVEMGKQLGVRAIPVFFLNGRRLEYWSRPETWDALLEESREEAAPASSRPEARAETPRP